MFTEKITPRFSETDALGHINNTVIPVWFEQARKPVFQYFTPDLDPKKWRLIIARIEVDFLAEITYGFEVAVQTSLSHIGKASLSVIQELYQKDQLCARGKAVLVHFDYAAKKSVPIPDDLRTLLTKHLPDSPP